LLLAGGIAERADVGRALEAGADGAVAGTRFLLSEESRAHPTYRQLLLDADSTLLTDLFGMGWPAPHRVVANSATERWLERAPSGSDETRNAPALNRAINRTSAPTARYMPAALQRRLVAAQRSSSRLLTPQSVTDDGPDTLVDAGPLYAGETVRRIADVRPAAEIVAVLTP
ncbi:MAG TPA: nitronate monooxygenase, partial [Solirubrobacterales bacterium]|nr:nitronate monooxygenase [Solirubrobacterales bacterium]